MDDLGRKFKTIDWKGIQRQAKKVQASTASALKDLVMTDLENKVRAATGDTSWGASSADLAQIAQGTYNREDFTLIMSIIWQRLASTRWRCVYKALDVLKYLVLHGASRVLDDTRDALAHIRRLEHYAHIDPVTRRDEGANVRARATAFVEMITEEKLLEEERTKSAELRTKIGNAAPPGLHNTPGGLSSDDYRYGAGARDSDIDGSGKSSRLRVTSHGAYGTPGFNGCEYDPAEGFAGSAQRVESQPQKNPPLINASVDDLLGGELEPSAATSTPAPVTASAPKPALGLDELGVLENLATSAPTAAALASVPAAAQATAPPPAFSVGADDDDDEDFDPRAGGVGASARTGGAAIQTSQLIANLAASRPAVAAEAERAQNAVTPLSAMQRVAAEETSSGGKPAEDVAYGGLVHFENLMLDKSTRVESRTVGQASSPAPAQKPVSVPVAPIIVEKDPFGDLLSTAKKTGVL